MPHNIERSAFRKGQYHGIGNGLNWRIWRDKSSNWWCAQWHDCFVSRRTLKEIGAAISDPANSFR